MISAVQDEECEVEPGSSPLKVINCYTSRIMEQATVNETFIRSITTATRSALMMTVKMWRVKVRAAMFNVVGTLLAYKKCQLDSIIEYFLATLETLGSSDSTETRERLNNLFGNFKGHINTQRTLTQDAGRLMRTLSNRLLTQRAEILSYRAFGMEQYLRRAILAADLLDLKWTGLEMEFSKVFEIVEALFSDVRINRQTVFIQAKLQRATATLQSAFEAAAVISRSVRCSSV
jgi:hypothetical protein